MCKLNLLSLNSKLAKSVAQFGDEILTAGLFLAPHRRSGYNVCPMAGSCAAVCNLWFSGRTVTPGVRNAMVRRTKMFFENHGEFSDLVAKDLKRLQRKANRERKRLFIRLNGASDLDMRCWAWDFPGIDFYDYTKRPEFISDKLYGDWPENYSLCYSHNEYASESLERQYLLAGGSVSMVFDTEYKPQSGKIGDLPKDVIIDGQPFPIIDGDKHDLRHPDYDTPGSVVGLRFKGSRKRIETSIRKGFTIATNGHEIVGVSQ